MIATKPTTYVGKLFTVRASRPLHSTRDEFTVEISGTIACVLTREGAMRLRQMLSDAIYASEDDLMSEYAQSHRLECAE